MTTEREIYEASIIDLFRYTFTSNNKDSSKDDKAMFALLCVLFLVGAESAKVLLRKNISSKGIDVPMLVGGILCFAGIAFYFLHQFYNPEDFDDACGELTSYFVSGCFFAVVSVSIAAMGLYHIINAKKTEKPLSDLGESNILSFLMKEWKNENRIRLIAEPTFILSIGLSFCFYNLYAGIAIIVCALSVWGRIIISTYFLGGKMQRNAFTSTASSFSNKKVDTTF